MTLGDVLKLREAQVGKYTVKASGDIVKGNLYCDDGSGGGLVITTAALAPANKVVMALEDHDYSENTSHVISCLVRGYCIVAKVSGSGLAAQGNKLMISGTAGAVGKFVAGDVTSADTEATNEAANLVNLGIVGYATKTSTDAEVVQEMYLY